jgi:hypothetical protein
MANNDLRRRLGGAALIVAPLVLLAAAVIHPRETADAPHQLEIAGGALDRWYLAHLLYVIGFALFVPAVLALARRLRSSAPRAELWGTGLAVVGLFASTAVVAVEGLAGWQLAQAANRAAAADAFDRIVHSAGIVVPFGIVGIAVPAGVFVLAVALARARSVAPWVAWTLAAGAVLLAVGLSALVKPALLLGLAGLAVAMGSVGLSDLGLAADSFASSPAAPYPVAS